MKTKKDLINEIFEHISEYNFKTSNENVINISCRYNDYEKILDVHKDVKNGLVSPENAIEFLSGFTPIKKVIYI